MQTSILSYGGIIGLDAISVGHSLVSKPAHSFLLEYAL